MEPDVIMRRRSVGLRKFAEKRAGLPGLWLQLGLKRSCLDEVDELGKQARDHPFLPINAVEVPV